MCGECINLVVCKLEANEQAQLTNVKNSWVDLQFSHHFHYILSGYSCSSKYFVIITYGNLLLFCQIGAFFKFVTGVAQWKRL